MRDHTIQTIGNRQVLGVIVQRDVQFRGSNNSNEKSDEQN